MAQETPTLSPYDTLLTHAQEAMTRQGIDSAILPVETAMIALNPPGVAEEVAADELGNAMSAATQGEFYDGPMSTNGASASRLIRTTERWVRPRRRRTMVTAVAVGALASAVVMVGLGAEKHRLAPLTDPGDVAAKILPDNNMTRDESIMPGRLGFDVPVVDVVVRRIPGIPDFGDADISTTRPSVTETFREEVTTEADYKAGTAVNPFAPDLELTGDEYPLARRAAEEVLDKMGSNPQIDDAMVTGLASDEKRDGNLGIRDTGLWELASKRAEVGEKALRDEVQERGIALPEPTTIGVEKVLNSGQVGDLAALAAQNNMNEADLLIAHNTGRPLEDPKGLLTTYIDNNRGVNFNLHGTKEVTREVPVIDYTETPTTIDTLDFPGEAVVGTGLFAANGIGVVLAIVRKYRRPLHRRARKEAKAAGLDISKVAA